MSEEARFREYVAAFARADYAALVGFYHPEVRLTIGTGRELVGREAIAAFYTQTNQETRREIRIADCFAEGDRLAAELHSTITALLDNPGIWAPPMRAGDRLSIESFALYELEGGLYRMIRAAVFRRTWLPQQGER